MEGGGGGNGKEGNGAGRHWCSKVAADIAVPFLPFPFPPLLRHLLLVNSSFVVFHLACTAVNLCFLRVHVYPSVHVSMCPFARLRLRLRVRVEVACLMRDARAMNEPRRATRYNGDAL